MIPVEQILDKKIEQAKQGSCKTCRWCLPLSDAEIEDWFNVSQGRFTPTHFCGVQYYGVGLNGLTFSQESLDAEPYPGRCDDGCWHSEGELIRECLAYQPGSGEVQLGRAPIVQEVIKSHCQFMRDLAEAIHISNAIQNNTLAKLTAKLSESKESMPAVPAI